jgi:hypothetical protein
MPQQWPQTQVDQRTFGAQIQRTLDDLNRPSLQGQVTSYLQDAMRFWQRKPFFFTDADNSAPLQWQASVIATHGCTIQYTSTSVNPGVTYAFVAANYGITGTTQPNFESIIGQTFVIPPQSTYPPTTLPPPPIGTPGTIVDNGGPSIITPPNTLPGIIWINNGPILGGFHANPQLSTLYGVNQYYLPIDLIAFTRVEVTWARTIRLEMAPASYQELRDMDVIRPTPPTTYPTVYCYYQEQLYLWPYPVGLYPITFSYRSAPIIAQNATDTNVWTTTAEAMVRHYAEGRINEALIGDQQMAQMCYDLANQEFLQLQQQTSQRDVRAGIPPSDW